MNEIWKNYWPIYQNLEKEIQRLSFDIQFCDKHAGVFSVKITSLLSWISAECEGSAKILAKRAGLKINGKKCFFNYMKNLSGKYKKMTSAEIEIIWPFQNFSQSKVKPFENLAIGKNPVWFNAYNKVKHDRENNIKDGNLKNVIDSLAGLFVLNILLRKEEIDNANFSRIFFSEKKKRLFRVCCA